MKLLCVRRTITIGMLSLLIGTGLVVVAEPAFAAKVPQPVLISEEDERQFGEDVFAEIKKESTLDSSTANRNRIDKILKKLTPNAGVPKVKWEFIVIVDESPNAFAVPGGKIGVNTGMFDYARKDDELAAVLAHEIAHVKLRHGAKRLTRDLIKARIADKLGGAAKKLGIDAEKTGEIQAALGAGAVIGVELPFSRTSEHEADAEGMRILKKSGMDPKAMIRMLTNLSKVAPQQSDWASTHPADKSRIDEARKVKV
jgi:metalloendopeptidase OMA1, mitochondrial